MIEGKIKLSVLGFSFNQTQSGTYGLVLAEEEGVRRLMVVIGTPEAQSIAFKLHDTEPPRPLTHDLFQVLLNDLSIILQEVVIYKYEEGVFFSKLILKQNDKQIEVDSRTSDAIAIALRTKSSIYTTENIMQELAIVFTEKDEEKDDQETLYEDEIDNSLDYSLLDVDELGVLLDDAIEDEDYELASILRDEIDNKNKNISAKTNNG